MGNFLTTPITEKDTDGGEGNGLFFGLATMQGWRTGMEDAHVAQINPEGLPQGCSLFAVFDGHGGRLAADLAAEGITKEFAAVMKSDIFPGGKAEGADPKKIGKAMRDAFMNLDQNIRKTFDENYASDQSGCTAITALVTPTHIIVANSGDSRSVMAKGGRTVEMSFDHKPINAEERKRIEQAGGLVRSNRVNGDLAVSRALGDFSYKARADLPAEKQQVSAEPEIQVQKIEKTEEFLVLACDGIWDVMSNDEICAYIRQLMNDGEMDLKLIAEEILDNCLRAGSRDNMSVVIVKFPGAKFGQGGGVSKIREERARLEMAEQNKSGDFVESNSVGVAGALSNFKSS
ncbi:protein phosphatase [Plasmopara halstedii]|uniref:protein-serine/threonine phosphatase n=1 Tax=Plasmopara halstedii TaxID=4781 RepID=A0A0P1A555_PLAHL|nr:protein phosphatase [Plasmopara halstedii]CEG35312.1 protein phosphatase [Plasmopara halstedii]|eukprot:XP_024571681.1 protein phosphatase [Plasmopara halstedii]